MTVLIAGCGDLGTEVGLRFAATGRPVLGLRRRATLLPDAIDGLSRDLTRPFELPAVDPIEILVVATAADGRDVDTYRRAYLDGLDHVLDALEAGGHRPGRALLVSSTGVYGVEDGSWVDESTPAVPSRPTGRILLETEQRLHQRMPAAVAFRLAGIYGPGRTRLIDQIESGDAVLPEPDVHTNRIHRDDAAAAIVHLMTMAAEPPPLLIGTDDDPALKGDVLRFLADELGRPVPPRAPVERRRGGDKRCRNAALRATGFELRYPDFRAGYRAVLAGQGTRHR
jgi:nucleoside-diphosphate-sugar epimerase